MGIFPTVFFFFFSFFGLVKYQLLYWISSQDKISFSHAWYFFIQNLEEITIVFVWTVIIKNSELPVCMSIETKRPRIISLKFDISPEKLLS